MFILFWATASFDMFTLPDITTDLNCLFPSVIVYYSTHKLVLQTLKRNKSKQTTKYQQLSKHIATLISGTRLEIDSCVWQLQMCICI